MRQTTINLINNADAEHLSIRVNLEALRVATTGMPFLGTPQCTLTGRSSRSGQIGIGLPRHQLNEAPHRANLLGYQRSKTRKKRGCEGKSTAGWRTESYGKDLSKTRNTQADETNMAGSVKGCKGGKLGGNKPRGIIVWVKLYSHSVKTFLLPKLLLFLFGMLLGSSLRGEIAFY